MKSGQKPAVAPAGSTKVVDAEFEEMPTVRSTGMTQIRTSYLTAQVVPRKRDLKSVIERCLAEAELAGEDFYYSWTQGGALVEGMSIDGAMIVARNYGNCVAEAQVVLDAPTFWLFDALFVDLETGFSCSRQFRQRKGQASQRVGKDNDADRLLDIAFQIGQSKAVRNVIDKAMPAFIVNPCTARAKEAAAGRYANIPDEADAEEQKYAKIKVTLAELETKIGRPKHLWTSEDIRVLRAIGNAIKGRHTSVEAEFRTPAEGAESPATPAPPASQPRPVQAATAATAPTAAAPEPHPSEAPHPPQPGVVPAAPPPPIIKELPPKSPITAENLFKRQGEPVPVAPERAAEAPKPAMREPGEEG